MKSDITLQAMMSDDELNNLFTVKNKRVRQIRRKPLRRGFRKALQSEDTLVEGVSIHPPGSKQRVADLAAFYDIAERFDTPPSAFDC